MMPTCRQAVQHAGLLGSAIAVRQLRYDALRARIAMGFPLQHADVGMLPPTRPLHVGRLGVTAQPHSYNGFALAWHGPDNLQPMQRDPLGGAAPRPRFRRLTVSPVSTSTSTAPLPARPGLPRDAPSNSCIALHCIACGRGASRIASATTVRSSAECSAARQRMSARGTSMLAAWLPACCIHAHA